MTSVQTNSVSAIGVGIDTSRYGHHVSFLRDDLQPATAPIAITETREGYQLLLQTLQELKRRHPQAVFQIRVDEASLYAVNLKTFLYALPFEKFVSIGDCVRNKNYRVAHFPKRKSDSVDSLSLARFAVLEQPDPTDRVPMELCALRDIASRLEAQSREVTRHLNQLHNVLSRVFPEFDTIVRELNCKSILQLLKKYPTPDRIARARLDSIKAIKHLRIKVACRLHEAAKQSIASLKGQVAETLVRTLVDQVCYARKLKCQYEQLLVETYRSLPINNQLDSIPGIGEVTAAVLTAKIISIERFDRPEQLVGYFGIFPEEKASGIGPDGKPLARRNTRMSKKGNDLVRHYLFTASLSATQYNPAARALYLRLQSRGTTGKTAIGHVMRKLLHLVFAVWKSGKPFDPQHYAWEKAAHSKEAAGHKQEQSPDQQVVTAAPTKTLGSTTEVVNTMSSSIHSDQSERLRIDISHICPHSPKGEPELVLKPVTVSRNSKEKKASSPPTPIDKSS